MLTFGRAGSEAGAVAPLVPGIELASGRPVSMRILPAVTLTDIVRYSWAISTVGRASALRSPHLARVAGLGRLDSTAALAFEPVAGRSLADWVLTHGPYEWSAVARFIRQIASGLAQLHGAGLLHGNLMSSNVRVPQPGLLTLTDAGLHPSVAPGELSPREPAWRRYAPPEGIVDPRSDLYSLGAIALEMATGAFDGDGEARTFLAARADRFALLPAEARALLSWLLDPNLHGRPASASAVIAAIEGSVWMTSIAAPAARPSPPALPARPPATFGAGSTPPNALALRRVRPAFIAAGLLIGCIAFGAVAFQHSPAANVSAATPLPSGPLVDRVLHTIKNPSIQFEAKLSGHVEYGSDRETVTGLLRVHGEDTDLVIAEGVLRDERLPDQAHVVRLGDVQYSFDRWTGQWTDGIRSWETTSSFPMLFARITDLEESGKTVSEGRTLRRLVATIPADTSALLNVKRGLPVYGSPPQFELWTADDGTLVGMEFQVTWMPGVASPQPVKMVLVATFDRFSGIRILPPT